MMKTLLIILVMLSMAFALNPTSSTVGTASVTIGAGSSSTITLPTQQISGDSLAYSIAFNKSNVSATLTYQQLHFDGSTDNASFGSLPVWATLDSGSQYMPTYAIQSKTEFISGNDRIIPYLTITNLGATTQTIQYNIRRIIWD